ncbi:MAG: histidine kinase [Flavipsychrobacter sp.]
MESWQEVDKYFVLYAGTAGMLLLCGGMLLFFRAYHKRLIKEQKEKNALELQYKDNLLYSNIQATEEERARIARDLHDEVGAALSLLRMQVEGLPTEAFDHTRATIDNTIDMVRRISHDLLPPTLAAFGLSTALLQLCNRIANSSNITMQLDALPKEYRFDKTIELTVYRALHELVNNTLKHAAAETIDIAMQYEDEQLMIQYYDDGKGYDYEQLLKGGGLGLKNIEARVKQCKGEVSYTTKGSTVVVHIIIPSKKISI